MTTTAMLTTSIMLSPPSIDSSSCTSSRPPFLCSSAAGINHSNPSSPSRPLLTAAGLMHSSRAAGTSRYLFPFGRRCSEPAGPQIKGFRVSVVAAAFENTDGTAASSDGQQLPNAEGGGGYSRSYHPSEEINGNGAPLPSSRGGGGDSGADVEDACLTDAEIARTMIEVNSKATLVLSGVIDDELHENVLWPDLSYSTDEHGDIYIEVESNEDILQNLTSNDNLVQVLVGLENVEKLIEVELSGPDINFGMEEIEDEDFDSEDDDDFDDEDIIVISDEDDIDDGDEGSDSIGDWTNLDTMNSSHPMYFAKKIAESVSNAQYDWMNPPSTGLVIQGILRPAFTEEHPAVQEKSQSGPSVSASEDAQNEEGLQKGTVFYKLEIINIQLVSSNGNLSMVKVQDFRNAQPDIIAHSTTKIISRLKSSGEKTTQALKSLCWKLKGIQVEEAVLTGVDSLGFDLRVCSGTQIQNLRFAFKTQATSEYSAERQLHDLLFPRAQPKQQECQQAHQKEP